LKFLRETSFNYFFATAVDTQDLVLILVQTFTGERRELCNACTNFGCVSISNSVTRSIALWFT